MAAYADTISIRLADCSFRLPVPFQRYRRHILKIWFASLPTCRQPGPKRGPETQTQTEPEILGRVSGRARVDFKNFGLGRVGFGLMAETRNNPETPKLCLDVPRCT